MRRQNLAQVCKRGRPRLTHWFAVLAASAPTSLTSQQGNSESSDSSNNAVNTTSTPLQASAKLEKLLDEAEEAFWASRKLTQMAGWTMYKAPRMPSSGRVRKPSVSRPSWTNADSTALSGSAGTCTFTPDFLPQQRQQVAARNAAQRANMTVEESQPSLSARVRRLSEMSR